MKHKKRTSSQKIYRRLSIGLTEKIYNELYELSSEFGESIANIIRLVIDRLSSQVQQNQRKNL